MSNRLKDKIAIVVGAGQTEGETIGNGRAISLLFAREGASLLLVDRVRESAMETKKVIEREGGKAEVLEADIISEDSCAKIAAKCLELYGKIDIVVNNVGIGAGDGPVDKLSQEGWDKIINVNLRGTFFVCKHVIPSMIKQQSGSIINISSVGAVIGTKGTAYRASKAGVNAITQMMAMSYAKDGIRVNAIMPGMINTPMGVDTTVKLFDLDRDELIRKRNSLIPLKGGMGTAWDVAYATLFLATDEAKFITAVVLPVDGGAVASALAGVEA